MIKSSGKHKKKTHNREKFKTLRIYHMNIMYISHLYYLDIVKIYYKILCMLHEHKKNHMYGM
jgi:hypothetical protein